MAVGDGLVVSGIPHSSYYYLYTPAILLPIYLQREELLYESEHDRHYKIEWLGAPNIDRALELLGSQKITIDGYCDSSCWSRFEAVAEEIVRKNASDLQAAQDDMSRSLQLSEADLQLIKNKCENFIMLKSICWAQTPEEREQVLATQGYVCAPTIETWWATASLICSFEQMQIELSDENIYFNCHNFNVCRYTFGEVAKLLIENNIIANLKYEQIEENYSGTRVYRQQYCGRGQSAELLCVFESSNIDRIELVRIELSKGASLDSAPRFD
jgi:hypothetical protein